MHINERGMSITNLFFPILYWKNTVVIYGPKSRENINAANPVSYLGSELGQFGSIFYVCTHDLGELNLK